MNILHKIRRRVKEKEKIQCIQLSLTSKGTPKSRRQCTFHSTKNYLFFDTEFEVLFKKDKQSILLVLCD